MSMTCKDKEQLKKEKRKKKDEAEQKLAMDQDEEQLDTLSKIQEKMKLQLKRTQILEAAV